MAFNKHRQILWLPFCANSNAKKKKVQTSTTKKIPQ